MILYCGNCNPDVDPALTVRAVNELYGNMGGDTLVVVSGCSRACYLRTEKVKSVEKRIEINAEEAVERWRSKAEESKGGGNP